MPAAKRKSKVKPSRAIIRIAPSPKPWELNAEQVAILKNAIAKGSTDDELKYCLEVARRYRLDPFRKQIWFVKRADRSAEGGYRWIPIVGIDGMLHVAARDHRDFGTNDEPEFGPMHEIKWQYQNRSGKFQAPEWARVRVWKKGSEHPTVATVYWDEIYPNVDAAPLVRQMPRLMIGKCALAQAIRRAYPETGGLYIKEEFQGPPEFTDGGRRIIYPELAEQPGSAEAAQKVAQEHTAELKAKIDVRKDSSVAAIAEIVPEKGPDESTSAPGPSQGTIELNWSESEASPIVRGDIGPILENMQKHMHMTWGKDSWWHCEPRDADTLAAMCKQLSFELKQIMPKKVSDEPPKARQSGAERDREPVGPAIVRGTIERVNSGMTRKNAPLRDVKIAGIWHPCYRNTIFEFLDKALGKEAELILDPKTKAITGIMKIAGREFEDGQYPVIQRNEDRYAKLF